MPKTTVSGQDSIRYTTAYTTLSCRDKSSVPTPARRVTVVIHLNAKFLLEFPNVQQITTKSGSTTNLTTYTRHGFVSSRPPTPDTHSYCSPTRGSRSAYHSDTKRNYFDIYTIVDSHTPGGAYYLAAVARSHSKPTAYLSEDTRYDTVSYAVASCRY